MPNTLDDLRNLGFDVGVAHGSVEVEEQALQAARDETQPTVLAQQSADVTSRTVQSLDAEGKLPTDPDERRRIATEIAVAALDELTRRADDRIAFHERAVAIAKEMPDVWVVSGPGVTTVYIACKPDGSGWDDGSQELLDVLSDPDAHKERCFQEYAPDEIVALAFEARARGADVTTDANEKTWTVDVDGQTVTTEKQLTTAVDKLPEPDPPPAA